ncbi:hypothetical protein DFH08DRAFT_931621 [Mycena albidolilacea]|uniref:Homeobox domain-containing protein n=1 Tax=Mycena albidolilacea TaxID=1033008 RepID=A0AAD7AKX3_9AGAR|nr:hypothetical protein DFH08DRAFT_931621 [Mycena albidolilacea]
MSPIEMSILRQIFNTANSIKDSCPPPCTVSSDVSPAIIDLPHAPSIQSKLLRFGLDPLLAKTISTKYDLRCQELRLRAQTTLHRTCVELARVPRDQDLMPLRQSLESAVSIHSTRYLQSLGDMEQRAMAFASKLPSQKPRRTSKCTEKRPLPAFNRDFIPFLEQYFEENAYPSSADRAAMAQKSMMEPRQIEVWFQNHRKRAKEEGRPVRRRSATDPAPLDLCLKLMEEKMEPYLIPAALRQEIDSEVSEPGSDDEDDDDDEFYNEQPEIIDLTDVLNPPAPPHAYPVMFKNSFSFASAIRQTQEFSFPAPTWTRKAAVMPPRRADITMDELLTSFSAFHVYDTRTVLSPPFRIATTVIPPTAPLPSLVRGAKFTPHPVLATTSLNTVSASSARAHPFRSPSPSAQPATLVPAPASVTPRRKKIAGPPRRTPKSSKRASPSNANSTHRGASPASSDTSMLRSMSPPSRTPSLEFSIGSPSPQFSFKSLSRTPSLESSSFSSRSSSCSSSGPATPSGSPAALPLPLDFSLAFDDFAGFAASPVEEAPRYGKQQQQFGFAGYAAQG